MLSKTYNPIPCYMSANGQGTSSLFTIFNLLKQTTSISVISTFLRNKGLTHSASSWDDLYNKRIVPAVAEGQLSEDELSALLASAEECGNQHIFLFQCKKGVDPKVLFDRNRVMPILKEMGLDHLVTKPAVLDQPNEPTIVDVRWETAGVDNRLVIKSIETRVSKRLLREQSDANTLIKTYEFVRERSVNVVRLHLDGLVEVRVGSHENSSQYGRDLRVMQERVNKIIPMSNYSPFPLTQLKSKVWTDREKLAGIIRFSGSVVRDELGFALQVATGRLEDDLRQSEGAVSGMNAFMDAADGAYVDSHNLWLLADASGLTRDLHIRISGDVHEFAIPARCNRADYENALSRVRQLNS